MRLIDADELLSKFLRYYTEKEKDGEFVFVASEIKQSFADMIVDEPTIDAVEVVRCKNCKNYYCEDDSMPYCTRDTIYRDENDYCSIPCRKDDE